MVDDAMDTIHAALRELEAETTPYLRRALSDDFTADSYRDWSVAATVAAWEELERGGYHKGGLVVREFDFADGACTVPVKRIGRRTVEIIRSGDRAVSLGLEAYCTVQGSARMLLASTYLGCTVLLYILQGMEQATCHHLQ